MASTKKTRKSPWFQRYPELREELLEVKGKYIERCEELGVSYRELSPELWSEFISRAVHESNWQEGIQVEKGRTHELTDQAGELVSQMRGPHVDLGRRLREHLKHCKKLTKDGISVEELAAFNLATAHHCIPLIVWEIVTRRFAWHDKRIEGLIADFRQQASENPEERIRLLAKIDEINELRQKDEAELSSIEFSEAEWLTEKSSNYFNHIKRLSGLELESLDYTIDISYVHFFHRVLLSGIEKSSSTGKFRKISVTVGDFDTTFPPPKLVPSLMDEYSKQFSHMILKYQEQDGVMNAAMCSHKFVRIHPYTDGNGRVSRLIMNLVLRMYNFFPVYIHADKKGSRRYLYALKRANNGNYNALAALIAQQLIESYNRALQAIESAD